MVIEYALRRWARGEEEAAQRGAIDPSFHGINLTCWIRVLSAARAAGEQAGGATNMAKITGETLTDEMIRGERARAVMHGDDETADTAAIALGKGKCVHASVPGGRRYPTADEIHAARERIAAAINARGGRAP